MLSEAEKRRAYFLSFVGLFIVQLISMGMGPSFVSAIFFLLVWIGLNYIGWKQEIISFPWWEKEDG